MSANPLNRYNRNPKSDLGHKPICVSPHVKDHYAMRQKTRGWISSLDILKSRPPASSNVTYPILDPLSGVRVRRTKLVQLALPDNSHELPGSFP